MRTLPSTYDAMDMLDFFQECKEVEYLGCDTETTITGDIRDGSGYTIGVSLSTGTRSVYFPFRHETDNLSKSVLGKIEDIFNHRKSEGKALVFHNAKFDLVALNSLGIPYNGRFYCTLLMAHMIDENLPSKKLDDLSKKFLNDQKDKANLEAFVALVGWNALPPEVMADYAAHDAYLTWKLREYFWPSWVDHGYDGPIWEDEQKFVRNIISMEREGISINADLCREQITAGEEAMIKVCQNIGINPGERKAMEYLFFEVLRLPIVKKSPKTGKASFDKDAMGEYDRLLEQSNNPVAKEILEFRGWQKTVSSNYIPYMELVGSDGRLRPNYKIHGTKTGRLSCEKPNLQQIPRVSDKPWNGELKRAFIPSEGTKLWEFDYSQLEFRLTAAYAREKSLIKIFNDPTLDVFSTMAADLNMARQDVKTLTYTIAYGGGLERISRVFQIDKARAKYLRDEVYFGKYPGIKRVSEQAYQLARARGYVNYWTGRRRHFEYPESEGHKAFNAAMQGGAAEIVKNRLEYVLDGLGGNGSNGTRVLLQIHDAFVVEIPEKDTDQVCQLIRTIMEDVPGDFGVDFKVDVHEWGAK